MKKKKISLLILTLALTASLLAACGTTGDTGNKATTNAVNSESSNEERLSTEDMTDTLEGVTSESDDTMQERTSDGVESNGIDRTVDENNGQTNSTIDGVDVTNTTNTSAQDGVIGDAVSDIASEFDGDNHTTSSNDAESR